MAIGIDALSLYTPGFYLPLNDLASARGVDPLKFRHGLGQIEMTVLPPDEDVVTMAANAARPLLNDKGNDVIDAIIVGTEGGVDQSKAAAIYVHRLLGLPSRCLAFEVKQACCGGTLALMQATSLIQSGLCRQVLVVATDVARYQQHSSGEATQGAGACAMLVNAEARVLELNLAAGVFTEDVMDFWRPAYQDTANFDGPFSIRMYQHALRESWTHYWTRHGGQLNDFAALCVHMPFARMAGKAKQALARHTGSSFVENPDLSRATQHYVSRIGNTYTASLYCGLVSLLETSTQNLTGAHLGLFSYGSGCTGIFFSGQVVAGYRSRLRAAEHLQMLQARDRISIAQYEEMHGHRLPQDGGELATPQHSRSPYRLAGINAHQRQYVQTGLLCPRQAVQKPAPLGIFAELACASGG